MFAVVWLLNNVGCGCYNGLGLQVCCVLFTAVLMVLLVLTCIVLGVD